MSMWFEVHSLSLEELELHINTTGIINKFVDNPKTSIIVTPREIKLPQDCFFSKQRVYNLANYFIAQYDQLDDDYYIGKLRFVYNKLNKDIVAFEKGKTPKPHDKSIYYTNYDGLMEELLNLKAESPESWESFISDLKEIRDHLAEGMRSGKRDNFIFTSYIN